ncbi:DUF2218 domain-containing protein [Paracoccus sp. SSK6]|uniref:DUF2218 domain-containing protein n=1 Tax=Paracoccus sp. SSK6 TaxID=3143131 RepID=UPI0032191690
MTSETPGAGPAHRSMTWPCEHFDHRIPATIKGNEGAVTPGAARLVASGASLDCRVARTGAVAVRRLQGIIDRHLARFACGGIERMDWQDAS